MRSGRIHDAANDIFIGLIIALISIPISMGYASVAGLPVVYGLYGSLFPVIIFGIVSSSPGFVFGVDAAPAALVAGMLAALDIAAGSYEALQIIPVVTLIVAALLLMYYLL
ncbi:MAG: sulfate transporter, partial [Lachnospiraceae bacterium]|nr:sulfate transporter [Lachnospiraceae bacterium]